MRSRYRFVPNAGRLEVRSRTSELFDRRQILLGAAAVLAFPAPALAQARHSLDPGIFFDSHGLIVQRDGDGGDTAQREGFVWFGKWLFKFVTGSEWPVPLPIRTSKETFDLLEVKPGEFCRNPFQPNASGPDPDWKINPDKCSRDQITPIIAAMGVWGDHDRLTRVWQAKRPCLGILTCVQGTQDLFTAELVNLYRRAQGIAPDPNGDKASIVGVLTRLQAASQNADDTSDDLNQVVHLLMSKVRQPSADTDKAASLYAKGRPISSGSYLGQYRKKFPGDYDADEKTMQGRIQVGIRAGWKAECAPVLGALRWYFRAESGGCSALAELYAPAIEKWLS